MKRTLVLVALGLTVGFAAAAIGPELRQADACKCISWDTDVLQLVRVVDGNGRDVPAERKRWSPTSYIDSIGVFRSDAVNFRFEVK